MERRAVIDLGTNTFNLLIADIKEGSMDVLYSDRFPVMLGMDGINDGRIASDAMIRAKQTLRVFVDKCISYNVVSKIGFGTSALRDAVNREELVLFAANELNLPIHVISGEQEAELIYRGVCWAFDFKEPAIIMDIGGGSTEFIRADEEAVRGMESLNIGVSRIYQELGKPKDYSAEAIKAVFSFLDDHRSDLLHLRGPRILIGASGTFETFYEMIFHETYVSSPNTIELPIQELRKVLDWSVHSSYEERLADPWITSMRKSMLPIAAIKVIWAMELLKVDRVLISPYSLKEGALNWNNL